MSGQQGNVLDDLAAWFGRFIKTGSVEDTWTLALWAAHTHLVQQQRHTPRLIVTSSMPESGKTSVLEHMERLCPKPILAASVESPSLMAALAGGGYTVLIDEAEKNIGNGGEHQRALLGIVNSGWKAGAVRPVQVPGAKGQGWALDEVPIYGPVALAGNAPNLPDDFQSRSFTILLMPDLFGTSEEYDPEDHDEEAAALKLKLTRWADSVRDDMAFKVDLPEGVRNRVKECWRPMKRAAVKAGGEWPGRVDQLALRHLDRLALMKSEGLGHEKPHIRLARDIHEVWPASADYLPTEGLLTDLRRLKPMDWDVTGDGRSPLTAQRLGKMLVTNFAIFSDRQERMGQRGYYRAQFRTAWESLGLETGSSGITPETPVGGTPASSEITSGGSKAAVEDGRFDVKDHLTPLPIKPAQPARTGATGATVSA